MLDMKEEISCFPHCDPRILHAPGECEYCDEYPEWQKLRTMWNIAFTGHSEDDTGQYRDVDGKPTPKIPCPSEWARPLELIYRWGGNIPKPKVPGK